MLLRGIKRKRFFERETVGIGRVILPAKQDREKFLTHCYQTCTISYISRENGGDIVHDVDIDPNILQDIEFPEDSDKLGSTVVWLNIPIFNRPIIVAKLNNKDDMSQFDEGQFRIFRSFNGTSVGVIGRAKSGQLSINIHSDKKGEFQKNGKMKINVSNIDGTAELDITVFGDISIGAKNIKQTYSESYEIQVTDNKVGTKSTNLKITNKSIESRVEESTSGYKYTKDDFILGDGSSTMPIAEEIEKLFHNILDELAKSQVTTAIGPSPLLNIAQLQALKKNTTKIFSKYLKIQ